MMNEYELDVLYILNGQEDKCKHEWVQGAAMNECASWLRKNGYATGLYNISEKGKKYLQALDNTPE